MNKYLLILLLCTAYFPAHSTEYNPTFSFDYPFGPSFTEEEKNEQIKAGSNLADDITRSFHAGERYYRIPPGDYRFDASKKYAFELSGLHADEDNPFVIDAAGVTFWLNINPAPSYNSWGIGLENCSHIEIRGLILDSDPSVNIEGRVTRIDEKNNRIEIKISPGFKHPKAGDEKKHSQMRIIPYKANGNHIASMYTIDEGWGPGYVWLSSVTPSSEEDHYWLNLRQEGLLKAATSEKWFDVYGKEGTLEIGDGIAYIYSSMWSVSLDNCKKIVIKDLDCYVAKGGLSESDGYGAHQWINCRFIPRPYSNRLQGGDGTMSNGMRHGSVFDGFVVGGTSDDAINIHGDMGFVKSVSGKSFTAGYQPKDLRKGDKIEFYNPKTGELLLQTIVKNITNGKIEVESEINVSLGSQIRYCDFECDGWVIRNSMFKDTYQRILIQSGSGVFANNWIERLGSPMVVESQFGYVEGGFMKNIQITDNVFLNTAVSPYMPQIKIGFLNTGFRHLVDSISVKDNIFVSSGGAGITIRNCRNIWVDNNLFVDNQRPVKVLYPQRKNLYIIETENVENLQLNDNTVIQEKPDIKFVKKDDEIDNRPVMTIEDENQKLKKQIEDLLLTDKMKDIDKIIRVLTQNKE